MQAAQAKVARPPVAYRVVRDYRLFRGKAANPTSEVWAVVDYLPPDRKTFAIRKRAGSSRGEDVVKRILEHESKLLTSTAGSIDDSNYAFAYLGQDAIEGHPCYVLRLDPRRNDVNLIRGSIWIEEGSFVIRRIQGQMAKAPSWFLKRVDLKIDFADLEGVWLQTSVEAVADVRVLGNQTLRSETIDAQVGNLVAERLSK